MVAMLHIAAIIAIIAIVPGGGADPTPPLAVEVPGPVAPGSAAQIVADALPPSILDWRPAELTGPLVTDRPDFTESADAVPFGHLQLEVGYTFTYDREHDTRTRTHTGPEMLWRFGLAPDFELRVGWDGYNWAETLGPGATRAGRPITRETWDQGAADMSLGVKYKLFEQEGWRPHFGVIAELGVPSGSAGFSVGDVDPGLVLLWAYDLEHDWAIAGNVGLFALREADGRFL